MRNLIVLLCFWPLCVCAQTGNTVVLPGGTWLSLRLVSAADWQFELTADVYVDSIRVMRKGAFASGYLMGNSDTEEPSCGETIFRFDVIEAEGGQIVFLDPGEQWLPVQTNTGGNQIWRIRTKFNKKLILKKANSL
jgi:hypothetical protein